MPVYLSALSLLPQQANCYGIEGEYNVSHCHIMEGKNKAAQFCEKKTLNLFFRRLF